MLRLIISVNKNMQPEDLIGKGYPVKDLNNKIIAIRPIIDAWTLSDQVGFAILLHKDYKCLNTISYEAAARIVNYNEWQDLPKLED